MTDPLDFVKTLETITATRVGVQRVRETILELALRGRLATRDPNDEPASILLDCVCADREAVSKARGIRFRREIVPPEESDLPYDLPKSWAWARLEELAHPQAGFAFKSTDFNESGEGVPLIRIRDIGRDDTQAHYAGEFRPEFIVEPGDFLVGMDGNFNVRRWRGPQALLNQRVTRLIFFSSEISAQWVGWALQARLAELHGSRAYTTVQHLSGKQIAAALIPVPPAAEQERLVARVEELTELSSVLEARQELRARAATRLRRSAVHQAVGAAEPRKSDGWAVLQGHWTELVDDPVGLREIEAAVTRLAVGGKLATQRSDDEPAERILERLAEIRGKPAEPLEPAARPSLPAGWVWASFAEASLNRDAERVPLRKLDREQRRGPYEYYGASGVIDRIDGFLFDGELLLIGEDGANLVLRSTPIAFMASGKFWVNNHAHVIDSVEPAALRYLALVINSIDLKPYLTGIAQPKLNQSRMNRIPIPLAPLVEQRRIVAEVDRLAALSEHLRERVQSRDSLAAAYASAATTALVADNQVFGGASAVPITA